MARRGGSSSRLRGRLGRHSSGRARVCAEAGKTSLGCWASGLGPWALDLGPGVVEGRVRMCMQAQNAVHTGVGRWAVVSEGGSSSRAAAVLAVWNGPAGGKGKNEGRPYASWKGTRLIGKDAPPDAENGGRDKARQKER